MIEIRDATSEDLPGRRPARVTQWPARRMGRGNERRGAAIRCAQAGW